MYCISAHHGLIRPILSRQGSFLLIIARLGSSQLVSAHLGSSRHIVAHLATSRLFLAYSDSTSFFFFLPGGAMPSPLNERVGRCCFCSYLVRLVFFPLDGLWGIVFSSRFFFLFFNLGPVPPEEGQVFSYFVFVFWPGEVSSAVSSGSFLDFVQVILGIERSPHFCHGWTFPFSSVCDAQIPVELPLKWWVPGCFVCNGLYPDQTFLASVILLPYNVLLLIGLASGFLYW